MSKLLEYLTEEQRQAVRTGSVDASVTAAICGTGATYCGAALCNVCLMPVKLDARGNWTYA